VTDGRTLRKRFLRREIEDSIPGFRESLRKGNKEDLGRKLFLYLKNKMIFECFKRF
jgi:hypothetical protein